MTTLLTLIALTVTTLSACAGQITPPSRLIKEWAITMNRASKTPELSGIDYAKIIKQDPAWTKEAVNKLFASIDSEKIKFADNNREDKVLTMVEPLKIKFKFEVIYRKPPDTEPKYAVNNFYRLVGIERIQEKDAQQAAPFNGDKPQH